MCFPVAVRGHLCMLFEYAMEMLDRIEAGFKSDIQHGFVCIYKKLAGMGYP